MFRHIKFRTRGQVGRAFDDLYVVVVSPTGLDLIKRDLAIGINMNGKLTEVSGRPILGNRKQETFSGRRLPLQVQA